MGLTLYVVRMNLYYLNFRISVSIHMWEYKRGNSTHAILHPTSPSVAILFIRTRKGRVQLECLPLSLNVLWVI
jgi:hypothetical protein